MIRKYAAITVHIILTTALFIASIIYGLNIAKADDRRATDETVGLIIVCVFTISLLLYGVYREFRRVKDASS